MLKTSRAVNERVADRVVKAKEFEVYVPINGSMYRSERYTTTSAVRALEIASFDEDSRIHAVINDAGVQALVPVSFEQLELAIDKGAK